MTDAAVSLRGISVLRSDQRLLDSVDLRIESGERVVVMGANGSGKTTLLRVLCGLMAPSSGGGKVLGARLPLPNATRRRIGAALDEPAFWPWMSAPATLRTVADLSGHPAPGVDGLLREVGLAEASARLRRAKRVGRFSQGMRKRLQVACALATPSDLLLLDEPTASLDASGADEVWRALDRRSLEGKTLVVATHDHDAASRLGARIIAMDHGLLSEPVRAA